VRIDRVVFGTASLIVLLVSIPILIWPEQAGAPIAATYDFFADRFGLLYQWVVIGIVGFLGWLAFSRHGRIRLGPPDSRPDFSTFSWVSMLFCAGVGAGLVYWATIEWAFYLDAPPFGISPDDPEALNWATAYGMFHWGVIAWTIYALPTVAIGYTYYVLKVPYLRLSTGCHTFLGPAQEHSVRARILDGLFMLALIGGAGTSMGLAVPMISASLADAFGFGRSFGLDVAVVAACVALFAFTVYLGIERGIQRLADLNVLFAFAFLAFVLIAGPTLFMLRMGTESIGFMFDNMIRMLTWTDPVARSGFVEDWTIFYWAWWIAFGPFVGIFVTRISRGRTLRELILFMAIFGSLGAWLFYIVVGNYALHLDLTGALPVRTIMKEQDPAAAIAAVIGTLPLGAFAQVAFSVICIIFIATTYNSAAYALASAASKAVRVGVDPARWHRLFWALILGLLPVALMSVEGGIRVVLSAVLVTSLPLLVVAVLSCVNIYRSIRQHEGADADTPAGR
jgi:BCCT family betaine/carnitine transporter